MGPWGTREETIFIRGLGSWRGKTPSREEKLAILRSYRQGIEMRRRWAPLDREAIFGEVDRLIGQLEGKR